MWNAIHQARDCLAKLLLSTTGKSHRPEFIACSKQEEKALYFEHVKESNYNK